MKLFKKRVEEAPAVDTSAASGEDMAADLDAVMRKYDRESNTRIWDGPLRWITGGLMAAFSLYCIAMTLWSTALPETRLSLFLACIVFIGFLTYPIKKGHAIVEAAPKYKDVKFVALDVSKGDYLEAGVGAAGETYDYNPDNWDLAQYADLSNVYTMIYQEELCGYMAGYATVKMGYTKLGYAGGMAVPAVIRYGYGFVQGANAAAKELGVDVELKYIYTNTFSPDASITAAMDTWYADGTQVVFACGGGIYVSIAEAAKKADGKIVGVDVDQAPIIDALANEGTTITSAMKGLAASTKAALKGIIEDGKWDELAGKIDNLGLVSGTDLEANYVGIPTGEGTAWSDTFTAEDYAALVASLFDGTITVSNDTKKAPADFATDITLTDLGTLN